jgi:uncharacterized protein
MGIKLRPHHFLCTIGFEGKGYSPSFVDNYTALKNELESSPETQVEVTIVTDSVCSACPSKRETLCESQEKIETLDQAHQKILDLKAGQTMTWKEAKMLIKNRFTRENMEVACASCSWKPLGMCERALDRLKSEVPSSTLINRALVATAFFLTSISLLSPHAALAAPRANFKPENVKKLADAWREYEDGNFQAALGKINSLKPDNALSDHQLAAKGLILRKLGDREVEQQTLSSAEKFYRESKDAFLAIRKAVPNSPWEGDSRINKNRTNLSKEASISQFRLARILEKKGDSPGAIKNTHEALGRLFDFSRPSLQSGEDVDPVAHFYLMTFEDLASYSNSCEKAGVSLCTDWLKVLVSYHEKTFVYENANGKSLNPAKEATASERAYLLSRFPNLSSTPDNFWKRPDELEQLRKARELQIAKEGLTDLKKKDLERKKEFEEFADQSARDLRRAIIENNFSSIQSITEKYRLYFTNQTGVSLESQEAWTRMQYWEAQSKMKSDPGASDRLLKDLVKRSPLDYYGLLAAWDLGRDPFDSVTNEIPKSTFDPSKEPFFTQRAFTLLEYDLKYFAAVDLQSSAIASSDPETSKKRKEKPFSYLIGLARLFDEAGLHYTVLYGFMGALIEKRDPALYNREDLKIFFPSEYFARLKPYAEREKLDPIIPLSVMRRESLFEPSILSSVRAMGLMQVMFYTARTVPGVDPSLDRNDLLAIDGNVDRNLEIGTRYLKSLIDRFKNVAYALASYNAGPEALSQWLNPRLTKDGSVPRPVRFCTKEEIKDKRCKGLRTDSMKNFIETIPYTETRKYVASIFRNYVFYKKLNENLTISPNLNAEGQWNPFWFQ